jgi:hypothetical protein
MFFHSFCRQALQAAGITFNIIIIRCAPSHEQESIILETNGKLNKVPLSASKISSIRFALTRSTDQSSVSNVKSQISTTGIAQVDSFNEQEVYDDDDDDDETSTRSL